MIKVTTDEAKGHTLMYTESDCTVECEDVGYGWWFARQRAAETGKAFVVLRAPESWEETEAFEQAW